MAFPLHTSEISDKFETGREKHVLVPAELSHFFPFKKTFVPAGPKCDVFWEGCDKKRHKSKKIFSCARASYSSQKCDKCDASHFLSPEKVPNVTSLTQIWDMKLKRNPGKTDPKTVLPFDQTCTHHIPSACRQSLSLRGLSLISLHLIIPKIAGAARAWEKERHSSSDYWGNTRTTLRSRSAANWTAVGPGWQQPTHLTDAGRHEAWVRQ